MRSRMLVAVFALLVASAAVAQQQSKNEFSIFATNLGGGWSKNSGSVWTGGGTLAFNHYWTPRFSTVVSAGVEHYYADAAVYDPGAQRIEFFRHSYSTNPFDVIAQYHFPNDSRWKPYIGGGFRYVHRPSSVFTGSAFAPELNGGVSLLLTPRFGLTLDGRWSTARSASWNPSFKPSVGVSWRF
ncbi:MAG TPA: outer membrane beta-barrel protein [Thermoanaerobaculia bacterium]|nr:outer membrane beta-barrel protein [Thermoanaerobaculia bacterium]